MLIVHKNKHLVSILQYNPIITYCLLGYFRISMWSVKISAWSVSGLKEIHRFERTLRHAAKQNIFFPHWLQKTFLIILHFQYFFINLPMLTMSETLSADAGYVPCGCPPMQKSAEAGKGCSWGAVWLLGTYIWLRRLLDALFLTLRNLVNFTYCQRTWQR